MLQGAYFVELQVVAYRVPMPTPPFFSNGTGIYLPSSSSPSRPVPFKYSSKGLLGTTQRDTVLCVTLVHEQVHNLLASSTTSCEEVGVEPEHPGQV